MTAVQLTPLELKIKMHPHTRPLLHIAKTFALVIAMALPITAAICTSASATT